MTELKLKPSATSRLYDTKRTSVGSKEKNQDTFSIVLNERTSVLQTVMKHLDSHFSPFQFFINLKVNYNIKSSKGRYSFQSLLFPLSINVFNGN